MSAVASTNLYDKLIADFGAYETNINGEANSPFHTKRKLALDFFKANGFPTTKNEAWKYTSLKEFQSHEYASILSNKINEKLDVSPWLPQGFEGQIMVFINGAFSAVNSSVIEDSRVTISHIKADGVDINVVGEIERKYDEPVSALNTAFFKDGLYVNIADNQQVEQPVFVLFLTDSQAGNCLWHGRSFVKIGQNSRVDITLCFDNLSTNNESANTFVTEIEAARDANIQYNIIQQSCSLERTLNSTYTKQGQGANVACSTFSLGGKLIRNGLNMSFAEAHSEAFMNGLFLCDGSQLVDNHTLVDHVEPNCMSDELYKGIMTDKSKGVFNGRIYVHLDAQKTNAYQTNRNVVLSDTAAVYTKPQLEIYADDVQCSHGCTIGQLDEDALFYMQARGINKLEARKLLLKSFAGEVVDRVENETVKNHIYGLIESKLEKITA